MSSLHIAALGLPSPFLEVNETEDESRVDDEEFSRVFRRCARLPFRYYGEVFDPTVVPPEDPSLATSDAGAAKRDALVQTLKAELGAVPSIG